MNSRYARQKPVISSTAAATITRASAGSLLDNAGATGPVTITLGDGTPQGNPEPGDIFFVDVAAAQALVISGGTGAIFVLSGTAYTAGFSLRNSGAAAGESCELVCIGAGPTYRVRNPIGSHWTVS